MEILNGIAVKRSTRIAGTPVADCQTRSGVQLDRHRGNKMRTRKPEAAKRWGGTRRASTVWRQVATGDRWLRATAES